jgi:hypothetical protein
VMEAGMKIEVSALRRKAFALIRCNREGNSNASRRSD